MYSIEDKQEAVRQLQKYLSEVGDSAIPIAPTGIYDDNTEAAVKRFQEERGIEATGRTDINTYELIYDMYTTLQRIKRANSLAGKAVIFPLRQGDSSAEIYKINNTLSGLMTYYGLTHNIRRSEYFSQETAIAVRSLKEIFEMEITDEIDEEFYLRIYEDEASIEKAKR